MNTVTTVNDDFNVPQPVPNTPVLWTGGWTPVFSTRTAGGSSIIVGGVWSMAGASVPSLTYQRPNNTITYDISLLATITLDDVIVTSGAGTVTLTLVDVNNNVSQSPPQAFVTGTLFLMYRLLVPQLT